MNPPWRLLDSGALPAPRSAAVDEAIIEAHSRSLVPDTLHFYTRSQPTVSLGRFQKVAEAIDLEACRARGVAVVRRRSGGGSIYTDSGQILFALISFQRTLGEDAAGSFARVCTALADSLHGMRIDAKYRPVNDVEVNGRKVSGSAQLRRHGSVLHHGSVLDCEHAPGSPKTGSDLITDQQNPVPAREITKRLQVTGRMSPHACGSLHQRFRNQRGHLVALQRKNAFGLVNGEL